MDDLFDTVVFIVEIFVDRFKDLCLRGHHQANVVAQEPANFVLHRNVLRITGGEGQHVFMQLHRDNAVELRHRIGDCFAALRRWNLAFEIERLETKLLAKRLD